MSTPNQSADAADFNAVLASSFEKILSSLRSEHQRLVNEMIDEFRDLTEQLNAANSFDPRTEFVSSNESTIARGDESGEPSVVSVTAGEFAPVASAPESSYTSAPKASYVSGPRGSLKVAKTFDLFPALHVLATRHSLKADCKKKTGSNRTSLYKFVRGDSFETFVLAVIVLSTITMCVEGQYSGYTIAHSLRVPGYNELGEQKWPGAADVFIASERIFLMIFSFELVLRLTASGFVFFRRFLNWIDFVVVVFGFLSWFGSDMFNPKLLRVLRIIRLARLLRGLTKREFFDAVHLLLISIRTSMSTLFWSLCVVVILQCIAALCVNQGVEGWLLDAPESDGSREVFVYFGTFTRSVMSMFEILIGNWAVPCRVLTQNIGEWCGLIVLAYRCICGFSVINVISAVFIQQTMKTMSQDTDIMLLERVRMEKKFKANLQALFHAIDVNDDGIITKEELTKEMTDPAVRLKCFQLGVDVHDLEDIFNLFCGKDDGMRVGDFIHAAHSVRKQANTLDIARLLMHSRQLQRQFHAMRSNVGKILQAIASSNASIQYRAGSKTYTVAI